MITLKLNDHTFEMEKEELGQLILKLGLEAANSEEVRSKGRTIDMGINLIMPVLGLQKPREYRDVPNLEFLVNVLASEAMAKLDGEVFEWEVKEVAKEKPKKEKKENKEG